MKDRSVMWCTSLCLCVGLPGLGSLALAGDRSVIDDYLAGERAAMGLSPLPRVDVPESSRYTPPPPVSLREYGFTEEPRRSMRPPWAQPADRMAPMSTDESRRMFCVAPDDCWFDRQ